MKTVGFIILAFGVLITIFTGLDYVTQEVVIEAGDLNVTRDESHDLSWSPLWGIAVILLGLAIFVAGVKRKAAIKSEAK